MKIGILAVQGAFIEHEQVLSKLGIEYFEIRQKSHLENPPDGIILPGGESTVMGKLACELEITQKLKEYIKSGVPVFGTCAGMILLAKEIEGEKNHLGLMDIIVRRNAYGRQLGSFETLSDFNGKQIKMVFIRAPYVSSAEEDVEVLSSVDGKIVAVRQNNMLATAFHPELTDDTAVHEYFISIIKEHTEEENAPL